MLEQKLVRRVNFVWFDSSPKRFERFSNFDVIQEFVCSKIKVIYSNKGKIANWTIPKKLSEIIKFQTISVKMSHNTPFYTCTILHSKRL